MCCVLGVVCVAFGGYWPTYICLVACAYPHVSGNVSHICALMCVCVVCVVKRVLTVSVAGVLWCKCARMQVCKNTLSTSGAVNC